MIRRAARSGITVIEMVIVLFLVLCLAALSVAGGASLMREYRLRGAIYHLRGLVREVRSMAASRSLYAGIVFGEVEGDPIFSIHLDGNGNGIRRADVKSGADPLVRGPFRLSAAFPGVRYGAPPPGAGLPPLAGLRIGPSHILSFSPTGTSTTGTIFLSNEQGMVYGVVVLGSTGRARVGRYRENRWEALP
jgi:Tfp pilus assembly protein FimT